MAKAYVIFTEDIHTPDAMNAYSAARAWYNSPAYQDAIPLRQAAADSNAAIISGFEIAGA